MGDGRSRKPGSVAAVVGPDHVGGKEWVGPVMGRSQGPVLPVHTAFGSPIGRVNLPTMSSCLWMRLAEERASKLAGWGGWVGTWVSSIRVRVGSGIELDSSERVLLMPGEMSK